MKKINFRKYFEAETSDPTLAELDANTTTDTATTAEVPAETPPPAPVQEVKIEDEKGKPKFKSNEKVKFTVEGTIKKVYEMAQAGEFSYLVEVKERKGSHEYMVTERGMKPVE